MKKHIYYAALWMLSLLTACTIDSYEKGEGEYSLLTANLVEAHVSSDKRVDFVDTDEGERLTMQPPATAKWIQTADTIYRALLYYNKVEEGKAQMVSCSRVGVLMPLAKDSLKEGMKTDPIHLESAWLSKNRKWLNLRLRLMTGSTSDEKAMQAIALVHDSTNSTATHAILQLYHDQGGQPEYYSAMTYASIPLSEVEADTLTLTVNTYDGPLHRTFQCKPANSTDK